MDYIALLYHRIQNRLVNSGPTLLTQEQKCEKVLFSLVVYKQNSSWLFNTLMFTLMNLRLEPQNNQSHLHYYNFHYSAKNH